MVSQDTGQAGFSGRVEPSISLGSSCQDSIVVDTIIFNDSSKYAGTLKNGVPSGLGTCTWADRNQYDGEWRQGLMHGFGTYTWTSGQRYDGEWKEGKRHGVGVKVYADGSTFNGFWQDGRKHGVGVFRPAKTERDKERERNPRFGRNGSVRLPASTNMQSNDSSANLQALETDSMQQMLEAPNACPPPPESISSEVQSKREKVEDKEHKNIFIRAFEDGSLVREDKLGAEDLKMIFGGMWQQKGSKARQKVKRALGLGKKLQQKAGILLYKGMPGYDLMSKLQLGVRYSIGRNASLTHVPGASQPHHAQHATPPMITLKPMDFLQKAKVFFPSSGSSNTPAHPSTDFKWKDYCPKVFRNLRALSGINDAEYMLSLGGSSALWQLSSPGKSGCMFFLSDDEKFLIKTMRKTEIHTLLEILPRYYEHMANNPNCLIIRFYGVHGVKQVHGRTVRFVVMSNMFNTDLQIHKRFDLKGSTEGRTTRAEPSDMKAIWKDLDLDVKLLLEPQAHAKLMSQVREDAKFLHAAEVIDYSMLLGIHMVSRRHKEVEHLTPLQGGAATPSNVTNAATPRALPQVNGVAGMAASGVGSGHEAGLTNGSGNVLPLRMLLKHDSINSNDGDDPGHVHSFNRGTLTSPSFGRGGSLATPTSLGGTTQWDDDTGGVTGEGEHGRNFDIYSDREEMAKQLKLFEERMRALNYTEQRIQDILGLARLKILGDKLKKRSRKASKAYADSSGALLKALQSRRHDVSDAALLRAIEEGEDEEPEDEQPGPESTQQPGGLGVSQLGYHVRALMVPKSGAGPAEEVILYFGIIDILQEWNMRKVLERTFKSITHDSYAISVAPPKLYSHRFAEFIEAQTFMDPSKASPALLRQLRVMHAYGVGGIATSRIEEEDGEVLSDEIDGASE